MRLQSQTAVLSGGEKYSVDQFALTDIRNVLKDQQEGIQVHLLTDLHVNILQFETQSLNSGSGCLREGRSSRLGDHG